MALSSQHEAVVFQRQDIRASTRYGGGQLCAGNDITGSLGGHIMVCLRCDNFAGAKLKARAEAYLLGFSKL